MAHIFSTVLAAILSLCGYQPAIQHPETVIEHAILRGDYEQCITLVTKRRIRIQLQDFEKLELITTLEQKNRPAAQKCCELFFQKLVDSHTIDPNTTTTRGKIPKLQLTSSSTQLIPPAPDRPWPFNSPDMVFFQACKDGDLSEIGILLHEGLNPNYEINHVKPIEVALAHSNHDVLRYLTVSSVPITQELICKAQLYCFIAESNLIDAQRIAGLEGEHVSEFTTTQITKWNKVLKDHRTSLQILTSRQLTQAYLANPKTSASSATATPIPPSSNPDSSSNQPSAPSANPGAAAAAEPEPTKPQKNPEQDKASLEPKGSLHLPIIAPQPGRPRPKAPSPLPQKFKGTQEKNDKKDKKS